jgi:hypothetical protein
MFSRKGCSRGNSDSWSQNLAFQLSNMPEIPRDMRDSPVQRDGRIKVHVRESLAPGTMVVSHDVYRKIMFGNLLGSGWCAQK